MEGCFWSELITGSRKNLYLQDRNGDDRKMNQYIFTPTGFYPDTQEKETLEKRYETLYHMGFSKRSKEMSSSELFLYELSETFSGVLQKCRNWS